MNAVNEVRQIKLMGRDFKIRSDSDPEYLSEVAAYVDSKIEDIATGQRHVAVQNVVLLSARPTRRSGRTSAPSRVSCSRG